MFASPVLNLRCALLPAALLAGALSPASSADKTFNLGSGPTVLSDVTDQVGLRFSSMRFVPGPNVWVVEVSLTNKSALAVPAPLVLWVDSFSGTTGPIGPDGMEGSNPAHAYYDFTAQTPDGLLWPGDKTQPRTVTLGYNTGAPSLVGRAYAQVSALPPGLALVRTLNEVGQPLRGVQVLEIGPLGATTNATDPVFGLATLGRTNGAHTWRFTLPGHLPVWRQQILAPGEVTLTPSPRLTRRIASATVPMSGGLISNAAARITVPPGAFALDTPVTLTPLTAQTLPAFLPLGWSPLQAFWLETAAEPSAPLDAALPLWAALRNGESAALIRWNSNSMAWEVVRPLAGLGTNIHTTLPGSGAYAVVAADPGPWPPPLPEAGERLMAANPPSPGDTNLVGGGRVEPSTNVASRVAELVTGTATVIVTNSTGALPSGRLLRCEIGENYEMQDGTLRRTPRYENFVVGYQGPGDTLSNTLHTMFPMQPLLLLGADQLAQATVEATVLPPGVFGGRVLGPAGGQASVGRISLHAAPGDFASRQALYLRPLDADDLAPFSNLTAIAGFDLGLTGIAAGRRLTLQVAGVPTNALFVLAQVLAENGLFGLDPVERLASNGQGSLASLEPASGERLPGIAGAGQYVLLRVDVPQGLITGVARNAGGQPVAGLPVRVAGQPWLTLSGSGGLFRLVSPAGAAQVTVTDPGTGDTGQTAVTIAAPGAPVTADLGAIASGPRVISVTPTNGAGGVARVTPVVIEFSEPIHPGSLGTNGIQLLGSNAQPIAVSVTLNLRGATVTLLPVAQLAPSALHTIAISTNLTDLTGLHLEGPGEFAFTTESDALNQLAAQVISYEPTNGMAGMYGSPGTAEPNSPVILVNETSGQTATILSRPDGSFSNGIPADVEDLLSAVIVNRNGTRNTIPVGRQVFRDGRVGLFNGGGILEAPSDAGPIQVIVEPGAIPGKTVFSATNVPVGDILTVVRNVQPQSGRILGGVQITESGDEPREGLDLSFPVSAAAVGAEPERATFALVTPHDFDGVVVYEIVDGMSYANGRLSTHSPPFPGARLRNLIRNAQRTQRSDYIQGGSALNVLFLPTGVAMLFIGVRLSEFATILSDEAPVTFEGEVVSVTANALGNVRADSPTTAVAGAIVRLSTDDAIAEQPGRLAPGQFVAVSDAEGKFALKLPVQMEGGTGYLMRGSHPRFPNQWATATVTRQGRLLNTSSGSHKLVFTQLDPSALRSPDTLPPTISLSHTPADPPPGLGTSDGALVTVTALDDRALQSLTLKTNAISRLVSTSGVHTVNFVEVSSSEMGSAGKQKVFRLQSNRKAIVTLRAEASDGINPLRQVDYEVVFAGDSPPPAPASDPIRPRITFAWPLEGMDHARNGEPITLAFSEPMDPVTLADLKTWFKFSSAQQIISSLVSPDMRTVTIHFSSLPGLPVSYSVATPLNNPKLKDRNGNAFDQIPSTADIADAFTRSFTLASQTSAELPGIINGGGVAMKGAYAYALERDGDHGKLVVLNVSSPEQPTEVGRLTLPAYPRDLAVISQYPVKLKPSDTSCSTKDLLAIVGGLVAAPTDAAGGTPGQFLWLVDITQPTDPKPLASSILTFSVAAVSKVKWIPPHLAYMELSAEASAVGLINLPAFLIGKGASSAEINSFPEEGEDGLDLNGDGEYCGTGERYPLPARRPLEFFGKEYSFVAPEGQPIVDFDVEPTRGLLAMVVRSGAGREALYQTVYARGSIPRPDEGVYILAAMIPRRIALLASVLLQQADGSRTARDLAILSIEGAPGKLVVLDISDPLHPALLTTLITPTAIGGQAVDFGNVQSIQRRADRLLALSTTTDVILLDPAKLLLPPPTEGGISPAIVGIIAGAGSGARSFAADSTGQNLVNLGGKRMLLRTPPFVDLITFGDGQIISPSAWLALSDTQKRAYWRSNQSPSLLLKTRVAFDAGNTMILNHTSAHPYYVRLDAPGGAGPLVDLVVESVDSSGKGLVPGGMESLPVRLAPDAVRQAVGDTNARPYVMTLKARRLSDTRSSEFYNTYLSEPFLLTSQIYSSPQRDLVKASGPLGMGIVKAGTHLWAGLAPSASGEPPAPVIGPFVARTVGSMILPGVSTRKPVEKPRRPLILIPGIAGSHLENATTPCGEDSCANMSERWPGYLSYLQEELSLDPNRPQAPIVATDVIRQIPEEYGCAPGAGLAARIYQPLIEFLSREAAYVEYNHTKKNGEKVSSLCMPELRMPNSCDTTQLPRNPNLFIFPYDWRKDNAETADALERFLALVHLMQPDSDQVDIIAHSMGGLVARRFILEHPGQVAKLITIGTPWLGAPKAFSALETGDFDDVALNVIVRKSLLKSLAEFFPGMHQLLPSQAYFDLGGTPLLEQGWDINRDRKSYGPLSFPQFRDMLDRVLHPASAPGNTTASFHEYRQTSGQQDDWRQDGTGVEYFHFFGMQTLPQTICQVVAATWMSPRPATNDAVLDIAPASLFESDQPGAPEQFVIRPDPGNGLPLPLASQQFRLEQTLETVRGSGDGTVPLLSATRGAGSSLDLNAPGAQLYAIVSPRQTKDDGANHNMMLDNSFLKNWIAGILNDDLPTVAQVTLHTGSGTANEGADLILDASYTVPQQGGSQPTGEAVFLWDFGDGTTKRDVGAGSVSLVNHHYGDNGTYIVSCGVAIDEGRITGFTSKAVRIANVAPVVTIAGGDATVAPGTTRLFSASVTDDGADDTHQFHWEVSPLALTNDGSALCAINFPTNGDYSILVKSKDDDGGVASHRINVHVTADATPQATRASAAATVAPASTAVGVPQLTVRISGQALGTFGSDGVDIRNEENFDYRILDFISNTARNYLTAVQKSVTALLTDSASENSLFANVFRKQTPQGEVARTSMECKGKGGLLTLDAAYKEGGVTRKSAFWRLEVAEGKSVVLTLDWNTKTWELKLDGLVTAPRTEVSGAAAEDRLAPAVAAVLNPATREVFVVGYDNQTAPNQLDYFIAQDTNGDGDFAEEVFYLLTRTNVFEATLPTRPFTIVAGDAAGNLSPLNSLQPLESLDWDCGIPPETGAQPASIPASPPATRPCGLLNVRRETIRTVVDQVMQTELIRKLSLNQAYRDMWILEQGSGACLWRSDFCKECEGVYDLNTSDNDFELILPAHLARQYQLNYDDREAFIQSDPYSAATLTGDWYFKPPYAEDTLHHPVPIDQAQVWAYPLPPGMDFEGETTLYFANLPGYGNLAGGFPVPLTPAELIALFFTRTVTQSPAFRAELRDVTFFPVRREHFMFGAGDLEGPPRFGSDPIGDAGMGRQMLMLKWMLEGQYVTLATQSDRPINLTAPRLQDVFTNLVARGIPVVEGLEWAVYQEYAALHADPQLMARSKVSDHPEEQLAGIDDGLRKRQKKILKAVGKAAIRTALARMAGDLLYNQRLTGTTPEQYRQQGLRSFEDFILRTATAQSVSPDVYGAYAADLPKFYQAKLGNPDFLNTLIAQREDEAFIRRAIAFIREVQNQTKNSYQNYLDLTAQRGQMSEYNKRVSNYRRVMGQNGSIPGAPGILQMTDPSYPLGIDFEFRVSRFGYEALQNADLELACNGATTTLSVTLDANTARIIDANANGTPCRLTRTIGSPGSETATFVLISGSDHDVSLADNSIQIETRVVDPGRSALTLEAPGMEIRATIEIVENKPTILFQLRDANGVLLPDNPQNIILRNVAATPPAGQILTNRVEIGNLPPELLQPAVFVAQGRNGSQMSTNIIALAASLTDLFRDGRRQPTEPERSLMDLMDVAGRRDPNVLETDDTRQTRFALTFVPHLKPITEQVVALSTSADVQSFFTAINGMFLSQTEAPGRLGTETDGSPKRFQLDTCCWNAGRQKYDNHAIEGIIYFSDALEDLTGTNTVCSIPAFNLEIMKGELPHEIHFRANFMVRRKIPEDNEHRVIDREVRTAVPAFNPFHQLFLFNGNRPGCGGDETRN